MKKGIVVIVVVVLAILAYNYISRGGGANISPDEEKLAQLTDDFSRVRAELRQANSGAAYGDADISNEINDAYREIDRIESSLKRLKGRLTSESAKAKAEKLQQDIEAFRNSL